MGKGEDREGDGREWRLAQVFGKGITVTVAELVKQPGVCAACRSPFREHSDAKLQACAATFEETLPDEAGA
jgi:hypothetical protein